jgi:hypothetical protein
VLVYARVPIIRCVEPVLLQPMQTRGGKRIAQNGNLQVRLGVNASAVSTRMIEREVITIIAAPALMRSTRTSP